MYFWLFCIFVSVFLFYRQASLTLWTCFLGLFLVIASVGSLFSVTTLSILWFLFFLFFLLFNVRRIRSAVFSKFIFERAKKNLKIIEKSEERSISVVEKTTLQSLAKALFDFKLLAHMMSVNVYAMGEGEPEFKKQAKKELVYAAGNAYLFDAIFHEAFNVLEPVDESGMTSRMLKNQALKRIRKIVGQRRKKYLNVMDDFFRQEKETSQQHEFEEEDILFREFVFREHSYYFKELAALHENDLMQFDKILFSHIGRFLSNFVTGFFLTLTQGYLSNAPFSFTKRCYQKLDQFSYSFSLLVDFVLFFKMPEKNREEMLTLLGEVLSLISLGSCFLKFLEKEWDKREEPLVDWVCQSLLFDLQEKMIEVIDKFPKKGIQFLVRKIIFPYGKRFHPPSEALDEHVATIMLSSNELRTRLISRIRNKKEEEEQFDQMEKYFELFLRATRLTQRLEKAFSLGKISGEELVQRTTAAVAEGLINQEEADLLLQVDEIKKREMRIFSK